MLVNAGTLTMGTGGATVNFPAGLLEIGGNAGLSGAALTNIGTLTVSGSPDLSTTLTNSGIIRNLGTVDFYTGGRISNLAGATFEIARTADGVAFNLVQSAPGFFNAGTLLKTGTSAVNFGGVPFQSENGTVQVSTGTLSIGTGGAWASAKLNVATGATLQFDGGAKSWTGTFTGAGAGRVLLNGGTVTVGQSGATLNFPAGLFEIGGSANLAGAALTNAGTLAITGAPNLSTTFNNAGTIQSSGQVNFYTGGQLNNLAGATFEIARTTDGAAFNQIQSVSGFFNAGTLRKSGGATVNFGGVPFSNQPSGIIEANAGTLKMSTNGTWQGADLRVTGGAVLQFEGGTKTWMGNFTGAGAGHLLLTAGTVTMGVDGAFWNFPEGFFELGGSPTLNGGTLTNQGALTITGGPDLATTLNNAGTIHSSGTIDFYTGGRLNNLAGATYEITRTANGAAFNQVQSVSGFFNAGLLRKIGTVAANFGGVPLSNAGMVEVAGGSLALSSVAQLSAGTLQGGTWRVLSGATLTTPSAITTNAATIVLEGATPSFPQLAGLRTNTGSLALLGGADLTITGAFTNTGGIVLSPGSVLTVNGSFTQTEGRLELQLGGTAASGLFGRAVISGVANLGGTLAVTPTGSYAPGAGESYTLLTFASRTGAFATFEGIDQRFQPVFELVQNPGEIRINSLTAAPDIAVTSVTAPASGFIGQNVTVSYTVTNLSNRASTVSNWTDAVYLSRDGILDPSDFLVGRVEHTGGIAALRTYTATVTKPLPGTLEGDYQVIVVADNRRVAPDLARANNQLSAPGTLEVSIAELTLGTPISGNIEEGQDVYYQVNLASGSDIFFRSAFEKPIEAEFFVSLGGLPTRTDFDFRAGSLEELNQQIRVLNARAGTYFILLHGREGAAAGEPYTLLVSEPPFALDSLGQQFGANVGKVTLPLLGSGFTSGLGAQLRPNGAGSALTATSITVVDKYHAFATFDLAGVAPGTFDVYALQGGNERLLDDAFTVRTGEAGHLEAKIVVPESVRMTRPYTITVEYENRGGTDIPIPLLIVQGSTGNFVWAKGQSQTQQTGTLQFLADDPDAASNGVLRPGEKHTITLNAVTNGTSASYTLSSTAGNSAEVVNYPALKNSLKIAQEPEWYQQAFDRVVTQLGSTYGELLHNLAQASDEAHRLGRTVTTFSEAIDFLVDREILQLPGANVRGTLFLEDAAHRTSWPSLTLRNSVSGTLFYAESFLDGSFSFFNVPAGTYTLQGDQFSSLSVGTLTVPASAPVTGLSVIGKAGEILEGRVLGAKGGTVGNALVQVTDALGREFLATTDAYGHYRVGGLAPGAASVEITASNFVPLTQTSLTLADVGTIQKDFTLATGGTLAGRVVSPTGTPVAGATLLARLIDSDFTQTITTGFDGKFRVSGLLPGSYEIVASGTGFGAGKITGTSVGADSSTPVGDVKLTAGGRVFGVITDATTGKPIAGARFGYTATGLQNAPILSSSTGNFDAANLTPGTFAALITAPGYVDGFASITLTPGENETLNVALRPLGKIDGVVKAGTAGTAGLKVTLLPVVPGPQAESYSVISGANGAFSFTGLPDGEYALSIDSAGRTVDRHVFTLNAADNTHTTNLKLQAAEVSGVLRGADGVPLAADAVSLYRNGQRIDTAVTDDLGRYKFLVFQSGSFDLIASGPDAGVVGALGVAVTAGSALTVPDLVAGSSSLTVHTKAQGSNLVVDGAMVVLRSTTDALGKLTFGGFSGATGELILPRIAPGVYEISITKKGFATEVQTVTIGAGGLTLDSHLDPGRVIFGNVRQVDGSPLSFAEVTFVDRQTGETFVNYADAAGEYRRDTLRAGSYDVTVRGSNLQPLIFTEVVSGTEPLRLDATLMTTNVSIKGVVKDASGDPLAGVTVRLLGPGDTTLLTATTDPTGHYVLKNAPAGAVRLAVQTSGFAPLVETLTLPASGETARDLVVGEAVAISFGRASVSSPALSSNSALFTASFYSKQFAATVRSPLLALGLLDGQAGDFATGLQPPSRFDVDTAAFRFPSADFDPDCPEQYDAYLAALNSGKKVDILFNDVGAEFERLKGLNDADVAETVQMSKEILLDAVNLADGLGGFKDAIKNVAKKGNGIIDLAAENVGVIEYFANKIVSDVKKGKLPQAGDLNIIAERLKGLAGLTTDIDFTPERDPVTGEITKNPVSLGGDLKKVALVGVPVLQDIQALYEKFVDLNDKVTRFSKADVAKRLDQYEQAEDRYLAAVNKQIEALGKLKNAKANGCGTPDPDPKPPEEKKEEDKKMVKSVGSRDPNDIIGPAGFGPLNFVAAGQPLDYTIRFENVATASAAAQQVVITHQLDADVDASSFQLGNFGFGSFVVEVPAGRDFFEARVDARSFLGVLVDVEAKIDLFTGLTTWTFSAIDPTTLDLVADPLVGFLPPNLVKGAGEGFVSYSIRAADSAVSGTRIDAQATIVFDQNAPIKTPAIFHTIDAHAPTTTVSALAETTLSPRVRLSWAGADGAGSGIASYDVFVSDNGGVYTQFLDNVTVTNASFRGQDGHSYSFIVVPEDNVGQTRSFPAVADVSTVVDFETLTLTKGKKLTFLDADGDKVTVKFSGPGTASLVLDDADGNGTGSISLISLAETTAKSSVSVTVKKAGGGDGAVAIGSVVGQGSLKSFSAAQGDLVLEGLSFSGVVGSLKLRDIVAEEATFAQTAIQTGGEVANKLSLSARHIGDDVKIRTTSTLSKLQAADVGDGLIQAAALGKLSTTVGSFDADLQIAGAAGKISVKAGANEGLWSAASFAAITVKGGGLAADLSATGALAKMLVKGDVTGEVTAGRFGPVAITGGSLTGALVSTMDTAALAKTAALASLKITGGDLSGGVFTLGSLGALSVLTDKSGAGGNISGATVAAAKIAAITVTKEVRNTTILAGANLGADRVLSLGDTFGPGSIGAVKIGSLIGSLLGAGFSTTDAILKNADDVIVGTTPAERLLNSIASLTVTGQADEASYVAVGQIKGKIKIGGAVVDPVNDPLHRFLVS